MLKLLYIIIIIFLINKLVILFLMIRKYEFCYDNDLKFDIFKVLNDWLHNNMYIHLYMNVYANFSTTELYISYVLKLGTYVCTLYTNSIGIFFLEKYNVDFFFKNFFYKLVLTGIVNYKIFYITNLLFLLINVVFLIIINNFYFL